MKRLFFFFLLAGVMTSCVENTPKVLLYVRGDGLMSEDLDYMLKKEAIVMEEILQQAGFDVVIATVAVERIATDSTSLTPDMKLDEVMTADYAGFIIPCMADSGEVAPISVTLVKKFLAEGKPVAAQFGGVRVLAKAGVLEGKKYANYMELDMEKFPEFKGAVYSGQGIIQEGNIITSGICPFMARLRNQQDGTPELMKTFIKAMKTSKAAF